jgi:hypothetical protein
MRTGRGRKICSGISRRLPNRVNGKRILNRLEAWILELERQDG